MSGTLVGARFEVEAISGKKEQVQVPHLLAKHRVVQGAPARVLDG